MSVEGTYELLFPFGQFEVERILGKLSTGRATSWLSHSKATGQRVVIKEVSLADCIGHEEWTERQWLGWARIHEIRTGRASAIYIRDYVEGKSLARTDAIGDMHAALKQVASICATLAPLHALGKAHGRLKPANIFVDEAGQVVLTDPTFDPTRAASQPEGAETSDASITFDPYYISPEQIREATATPASDIYSLGCILFELLAGKPPFRNVIPVMICYQHAMNPPPTFASMRVEVPRDLEELVQRMLSKSPKHRPDTAMELLDLIEPLLDPAYSPAAMTGEFTLTPEVLKRASEDRVARMPDVPPVAPEAEVETQPETDHEEAEQAAPFSLTSPVTRKSRGDSGTMIISRRELKRLIEEADGKTYAPGDTPILDPDERLPIPLVREAVKSDSKTIDKKTTRVLALETGGVVQPEGATEVMSAIQERETAIAAKAKSPQEQQVVETIIAKPSSGRFQGLLLAYSIVVTVLLVMAIGVIVYLLISD